MAHLLMKFMNRKFGGGRGRLQKILEKLQERKNLGVEL